MQRRRAVALYSSSRFARGNANRPPYCCGCGVHMAMLTDGLREGGGAVAKRCASVQVIYGIGL